MQIQLLRRPPLAISTRRLRMYPVLKAPNRIPNTTPPNAPVVYFRREVFRGLGQVLNRLPPRRGGSVPVSLGLDVQRPLLQTLLQPVVLDQAFHQTVQARWCAAVRQLVLQLLYGHRQRKRDIRNVFEKRSSTRQILCACQCMHACVRDKPLERKFYDHADA